MTYTSALQRRHDIELFLCWAREQFGQGYSLELDEDTFLNPVTRWAFIAFTQARRCRHLNDDELRALLTS